MTPAKWNPFRELEDLLEDEGKKPLVEETEDIAVSDLADAEEEPAPSAETDAGDDQDLDFELAPEAETTLEQAVDDMVSERAEDVLDLVGQLRHRIDAEHLGEFLIEFGEASPADLLHFHQERDLLAPHLLL